MPFGGWHFAMHFLEWKSLYFDSNFTEVFTQGSSWQYPSIGSGCGLVRIRWQANTWINDDTVHWCIYLSFSLNILTHWGRMTHICVSKLTIIGSDYGLLPGRHQAIILTNAGILLIWPLGTKFNEILIGIQTFSFKKMHLKMASAKWRPFCLGLNILTHWDLGPLSI